MNPKSSYPRIALAPTCRLIAFPPFFPAFNNSIVAGKKGGGRGAPARSYQRLQTISSSIDFPFFHQLPNKYLFTAVDERKEIVCKVRTQQAENFDEEVKSLVSAWCFYFTFSKKSTILCFKNPRNEICGMDNRLLVCGLGCSKTRTTDPSRERLHDPGLL